ITNARKNKLDYSDPYFQSGETILTASDNEAIKGKDDLAQKVVATRNGSTAYQAASEIQGIKIRSYANISDAYDDLKNKSVDAVIFEDDALYTKWFGSKPEKMPKELKHDMEKDNENES
ncbi:transporter substrate-binding domain-containing protein, partial [Paenibacillus sp. TAF58]